MKLLELFDKALPYKWIEEQDDAVTAQFRTSGGQVIDFDAYEHYIDPELLPDGIEENVWAVEFSNPIGRRAPTDNDPGVSPAGITGTGEQHEIFATVLKIMQDFINKVNPPVMQFSAKEPSRRKLYDRLVRMFANDYYVETKNWGPDKSYFLTAKNQ